MREIQAETITNAVAEMCLDAAYNLPQDTLQAIKTALTTETSERGRNFLNQYLTNSDIAGKEKLAICQDTGLAVFFIELGQEIAITGGTLNDAISAGVEKGYREGFLRMSVVDDPLFDRINTRTNTPPVIHLSSVPGDKLKITLAPKGGGAENMSALAMLKPSDGVDGVVNFVVNTVVNAGGNPCPPTVVGVGIGGDFELSAVLAKKALFRELGKPNPDPKYAELEKTILEKINASGVGPQGLGGDTTSLAVHIETYPCHIASLPVAVNLNCHASRHKEIIL